MAFDYRRVDLSTLDGLKAAERLQAQGWRLLPGSTFWGGTMERERPAKRRD